MRVVNDLRLNSSISWLDLSRNDEVKSWLKLTTVIDIVVAPVDGPLVSWTAMLDAASQR